MITKFFVGDLVRVFNTPSKTGGPIWPLLKNNYQHVGIIVDIIGYKMPIKLFFNEKLIIKLDSGEVITLSSNLIEKVNI